MEILRDSFIEYNIDTAKVENNTISFYNTDKNMAVLFVKLKFISNDGFLEYVKVADASKHSLELHVKKQSNEKISKVGVVIGSSNEDAIFRFDLDSRFTNEVGTYKCRLLDVFLDDTIEKKATSDSFNYSIKENDIVDKNQEEEPPPGIIYSPTTGNLEIITSGAFNSTTGNLEIGQEG